ncbi:HlyD family secretion protein [Aminobacter aganoensis]|uniref:HlyD family secretion protein n=1 Tax=Aminobacter aganoensis TaxID=83264 RepID=A0A7X0F6Q3_9HYPH|nr:MULTISPECIES: HlyD family efflux transporter periplasmic adaptor subunit [Aminobacter]KQU64084.1 hemolysin secretion protein D [Aminobacter sp. DSM 101952]MBB6353980.1 HlyD family secretion protein [Aminobacter aganoensis]
MSILCSIPFAASLFSACAAPAPLAVGYVEGDYVLLAPIEVAQVETVAVRRGDRVQAGRPIATLESGDARIAVTQAEAALAQARAELADLKVGKRPEEIAALEATVRSARSQAEEASRVRARTEDLLKRGIATQAQMDEARTQVEVSEAAIGLAEANLKVAGLPAREDAIRAAEKKVEQAESTLGQARWRLSKRALTAPADGRVDDVIRNAGDTAGPSSPVVSVLPDGAVKLTLFIPETAFSSVRVGTRLAVRCDGCAEGLTAKISYVSPDPEFTPPVIYSLENRQKLVYLVEARPEDANSALQPGQIVDVALEESE